MSCYDLSRLLFDLKMNETTYQKSLQDFEAVTGSIRFIERRERRATLGRSAQAAPAGRAWHALSLYQAAQSAVSR